MTSWYGRLRAAAAGLVAAIGAAETLLRCGRDIWSGDTETRKGTRIAIGLISVVVGLALVISAFATSETQAIPQEGPCS